MDNLGQHLFEQANMMNQAAAQHIAIGREQGRRELEPALRAILHAYDAAGAPPIPSPMLAAIEAARKVL